MDRRDVLKSAAALAALAGFSNRSSEAAEHSAHTSEHAGHASAVAAGYAGALEAFDARIPELQAALKDGDLSVFTADHGCDPSFAGTDHTREYVPVLAFGPGIAPGAIGRRATFADIGQSLAKHLSLPEMPAGTSFL